MTSPVSRRATMATKPLAIALTVAAAFSASAFAQTNQDKALPSIVVTASRTPQSAKDVLSDNIVITAEEIARSGHTSLTDLLQQKRGIELTRYGGIGNTASVFIRGAENKQSIVLVDGVRIGSSTLGGATWETIPLSQVDRVEIVYGPLSSLYGADAIGGVIQIFTKQGDGTPRANVSAGIGSFGTRNLEAGVSGATSDDTKLRYAVQAAHEEADGFSASKPGAGAFTYNPDKDGYKRDSASGQLGVEIAKGHELGLTFLQSRLKSQFDAGLGYDDRMEQELGSTALYAKNKFLPAWTSFLQLGQSSDKGGIDASYGKSQIDTKQTNISWQNDVAFGSDVLQLVLERREEKVDATTAGLTGKRTTNSAAASYQLRQGKHLASVALRNDDNSQFGTHVTGSIDYGYRITTALRANASIGTSFRAPTFNELYYPDFGIASNKPEKGRNAEAGLYYDGGDAQLSVVYYRNRITDLLVYAPVCPVETATHPFGCAYNVDQALLTGVSLGASTKLGSNFTVRGSLDVQDPRDETTDKRLARRAKKHGSIGVEYGANAINAGVELVFSGERFDDPANRNRLGGYGVLNLHASYDFAPSWSLFGRWNNVADKNYELARNYATSGSNLFVGVRYGMK